MVGPTKFEFLLLLGASFRVVEKIVQIVTFSTFSRKVLRSNTGPDTEHPD